MVDFDDNTTLAAKLETMLSDIADSKEKLATLLGDDAADSITSQISTAVQNAVDSLTNEDDATSLAGKIKTLNAAVTAINDASTGILATAEQYTDDKIGLSGTAYTTVKAYVDAVKSDINSATAGAFHFKGKVDYVDQLPTEGSTEGDVYQVQYAGTSDKPSSTVLNAEYAYDGTSFIELGSVIDLSSYYTAEQTTEAINTAKQAAIDAAAADATSKADAAQAAAEATAAADATSKANAAQAAAEKTAADDATSKANAAQAAAEKTAASDATSKADAAKEAAISAAATDATTKANAAQAAAEATAAADATSKANAAQAAAEATAAADATSKANAAQAAAIAAASEECATKCRFLVSAEQPEDLTEADVWAELVD
jgi:hypothetical protein